MNATDEHGLLDVVTLGMLDTLPQELEDRPDLAALLDLPVGGSDAQGMAQLELEASLLRLINGEDAAIQRATVHLNMHRKIRICPATCGVLWRSGINPIGATALAHARGHEAADDDMMPTRIRIHQGPAKGGWATIVHVIEGPVETIGMEIALANGFNWIGWGPHLSHRSEYDMPSTMAVAAAGKRLDEVVKHEALDGDIRIVSIQQSSGTITLDLEKHGETVGWLLGQRYDRTPRNDDLLRKTNFMRTLLKDDEATSER